MINTYKGSGIVDNRWIIDSDSHITEPRDVWTAHVPAKWRDHVPYVVRNDKGMDVWMLEGTQIGMVGTSASGTNPEGQWVPQNTYEDCHPAAYDSCERLRYMDEVGIWAQVLYPNVAGFGSQKFFDLEDPELQIACVRAYNDFLAEWCSADPNRLIGVMATPFWDVEETVKEIRRGHDELGFRAILFTGEPMRFGLPTFGDKAWDPFWSRRRGAEHADPLPHRRRRGHLDVDDGGRSASSTTARPARRPTWPSTCS